MKSSGNKMLYPCDCRTQFHEAGTESSVYGQDMSQTVSYRFNRSGYRGDDYDPEALFKICIVGESNAFGTGLALEETFGSRFKQHIESVFALNSKEVNLINLSMGGASSDYCCRTLFRQASILDFDLVICQLPARNRVEYFSKRGIFQYSPSLDPVRIDRAPGSWIGFLEFYNHEFGVINQVKNVLMMQAFFLQKKCEYIFAVNDLVDKNEKKDSYRGFIDQIDFNRVLYNKFFCNPVDFAADGKHAGKKTHGAFAIALCALFAELLIARGDGQRGRRLESYAEALQERDVDWLDWCNRVD